MYICLSVCLYVCMYVCMYVGVCVCMYVWVYVCMYIHMLSYGVCFSHCVLCVEKQHVSVYAHIQTYTEHLYSTYVLYATCYVYMYICMYVCMHVNLLSQFWFSVFYIPRYIVRLILTTKTMTMIYTCFIYWVFHIPEPNYCMFCFLYFVRYMYVLGTLYYT